MYCEYYQAHVVKEKTWFLVAVIRSFEHMVFDRTCDKQDGIFEFFVPQEHEPYFLKLMAYFEEQGIISNLQKLKNRFITE